MVYWIVGVLSLLIMLVVTSIIIDSKRFIINKYELTTEKTKEDYRFVVISDLHNKVYKNNNEEIIKAIEKLNPQGIFIAGDMITANREKDFHTSISFLERLTTNYPVYYGFGNHENKMERVKNKPNSEYAHFMNELERIGVKVLVNSSYYLEKQQIEIFGLDIQYFFYKKFMRIKMPLVYLENRFRTDENIEDESIRKDTTEGDIKQKAETTIEHKPYKILIAHNPDYFETYSQWGADLTLSGHVHGGIMKLPFLGGVISPSYRLFPKYDGGLFEMGNNKMIISRGLGAHTIPIRVFNPGEIILITLKKEDVIKQ